MKRKLNYGDIFSLEVAKDKYVFGRVLFDVNEQYEAYYKAHKPDDYLSSYFYCQLVEIYKGIYDSPEYKNYNEILIPRYFVLDIDIRRCNKTIPWKKVGHKDIDYKAVEFPEKIGRRNNAIWLMRGQLMFQLHSVEDIDDVPVIWERNPPVEVLADACLFLQDRKDLIEGFMADDYLSDSDLLYHPELRKKLYEEIGKDPDKSYYELSKQEGYDLGRFYK